MEPVKLIVEYNVIQGIHEFLVPQNPKEGSAQHASCVAVVLCSAPCRVSSEGSNLLGGELVNL